MRLVALAVAAVLAFSGPAFAQPFDTPETLLEAFYAPYLANEIPEDQAIFFSSDLNALYAADAANTPEGEMGALDFDPFIVGQDWTLDQFAINDVQIDGEEATAEVTFNNFDQPMLVTYDLVFEDGNWLIDDVVGDNDGFAYRLTDMLAGTQN